MSYDSRHMTYDQKRAAREELKSRVAELMSIGLDNTTIRTRIGMSSSRINRVIMEIRKDLGWQAV